VIGLIDEQGMARAKEDKIRIAHRAYEQATAFGIPGHDIFFDPLGAADLDGDRGRPEERG
jgi:5-methyltetrahydrofolate--homocysteine methyltransferase